MTRNLDYRVEVLCPVRDPAAQELVQTVLDIQWHDNVKARVLDRGQSNRRVPRKGQSAAIRSQEAIHSYLRDGRRPRLPRSNMSLPAKQRRKSRRV